MSRHTSGEERKYYVRLPPVELSNSKGVRQAFSLHAVTPMACMEHDDMFGRAGPSDDLITRPNINFGVGNWLGLVYYVGAANLIDARLNCVFRLIPLEIRPCIAA